MKLARIRIPKTLGLAFLSAALLAAGAARADEYADVNQLMRSGKLPEALTKADQYLAGKPKDPQMRFLKGVVLTEAGRTNEAIGTFQKLTEDYPELPEPYNNLAVLYAGQAQFDKARAALEMAIRTNPSYATAHENLGDVYAKLASQAYTRALQLDAGNTAVQPKLALIRELFSTGGRTSAAAPRTTTVAAAVAGRCTRRACDAPAAPCPLQRRPLLRARPARWRPRRPPRRQRPPQARPRLPRLPRPPPPPPAHRDVEAAVRAWAPPGRPRTWAPTSAPTARNSTRPASRPVPAWEAERRARIVGKKQISVDISDLAVTVNGNKAVARFHQAYSADALKVSSRKTLDLVKNGDRWTIVRESTGA